MNNTPILKLENITKLYPGVIALDDVSVSFNKGEVHAIVGENGAGKSTLIKIIAGALMPEKGCIHFKDKTCCGMKPLEARQSGIECIYQEFNLIGSLSAAENICYGNKYGKLVDYKAMNKVAQEIFDRFGISINPKTPVYELTSAQKQIVEIAKAVTKKAEVLIMDEPTASLTVSEIEILTKIISQLKEQGVTIIYISHRLEEIFSISDRVSVFRDGKHIKTMETSQTSRKELIRLMVGRELSETYPRRKNEPGEVALELVNLTGNGVKNVSFKARYGEILGLAGLVGAGRSEIMKVVYCAEKKQWGQVLVNGKEFSMNSPRDAMKMGIGLIPEDRKLEGCFLMESIRWNIVYNIVKKISRFLIVNNKKEKEIAQKYSDRLRIRTPHLNQKVYNLSGGNQQKVVVAKALATDLDIIIFDEPTRGIDVGAKHEIYELMNELCEEGKCIIMITSDMEELIGMSDRIVVLSEKTISGELLRSEINQERILELASVSNNPVKAMEA